MPRINFTESQKQDILDCLPKTGARDAYLSDLEYHARISPTYALRRVGAKKPFALAACRAIERLDNCVNSVEESFSGLAQAHRDDEYAPIPEDEVATEIERIREAIDMLSFIHGRCTLYSFVDGREKKLEKVLINVALGLWCRHFPENPLPKDPRSGRLSGGHGETPALRLCGIVIEAGTGEKRKDLRALYRAVLTKWDTSGVPLFPTREWEEAIYARWRDERRSCRESNPESFIRPSLRTNP